MKVPALAAPVRGSVTPHSPVLRRACACGGTPGPTGECEECRKKRLQRSAAAAGPAVAPPVVHDVLASPGRALDPAVRAEMEPHFRHSFADVRVHADGRADESARAVAADAYTVGRSVVFAAGRYAPASAEGRRLIAHELAHVVQQRGDSSSPRQRLEVGAVDDPAEREAEQAARSASPAPAAGGGRVLRRAGGWSDARAGGPNSDEQTVGAMRRIPVEGLTEGNADPSPNKATQEKADHRAIVVLPTTMNLANPVEVLLHFHGHNIGYRERTQGGTVRDVAVDRLEAQIEASGRPMIGVLAQGTTSSGFGGKGFNSDAYLNNVFDRLVTMKVLTARPTVQRVAVAAHSGGGGFVNQLLAEKGQPRMPSLTGAVFLYDAINGPNELGVMQVWVKSRLDRDLAAVAALPNDPAKLAYLQGSLRFRAYYTNTSYAERHRTLNATINNWFKKNAAALGGAGSAVFTRLRENYQVIALGHADHDAAMGKTDAVQDALGTLPPASPAAPAPAKPPGGGP